MTFAVGSGVAMAVKVHVAVALAWLLTSYVTIGLVESTLGLARKLRRRRDDDATEDPANAG